MIAGQGLLLGQARLDHADASEVRGRIETGSCGGHGMAWPGVSGGGSFHPVEIENNLKKLKTI